VTAVLGDAVLAPEDAARADLYALIAHLFYAPPTAQLLAAIAAADDIAALVDAPTPLATAWRQLQAACAATDLPAVADEYRELFVGVGRAAVPLQASWHRTGFLNEKPLSELRSDLAALGLSRLQSVSETEDHLAALAEVMRLLIVEAGDGGADRLAEQKRFFSRHVEPWYAGLAARIDGMPEAGFYRTVGALMRAFFDTEKAQFESF
jgi:TorA maturation chaperone TorD